MTHKLRSNIGRKRENEDNKMDQQLHKKMTTYDDKINFSKVR